MFCFRSQLGNHGIHVSDCVTIDPDQPELTALCITRWLALRVFELSLFEVLQRATRSISGSIEEQIEFIHSVYSF